MVARYVPADVGAIVCADILYSCFVFLYACLLIPSWVANPRLFYTLCKLQLLHLL